MFRWIFRRKKAEPQKRPYERVPLPELEKSLMGKMTEIDRLTLLSPENKTALKEKAERILLDGASHHLSHD